MTVQAFVTMTFFVAGGAYNQSFCGFWCGQCEYLFVSAPMMLTSLDEYF